MLKQAKRIHCIGIGGIGVSALAQFWHAQGKQVSGSDAEASKITEALETQGIKVIRGGKASGAPEALPPDIVIYSDAIPEDHPERIAARGRGVPELSYAQALGEVSREYRTIVVTGTHGKSTTTALLGLMLEAGGLDPLVIVGTRVPNWKNSNIRLAASLNSGHDAADAFGHRLRRSALSVGQSPSAKYFVVEGDDYRDHFLELQPYAVVVTSIEWDHPDYFKDLEQTVESFRKLAEKVPVDGFIVMDEDDVGCKKLHSAIRANRRIAPYGRGNEVFHALKLQVPGEFNRYNATAAATCAMELGVPREVTERVAGEFRGVWRRFEVVGSLRLEYIADAFGRRLRRSALSAGQSPSAKSITIISDYGHHPTAIRATMQAARQVYPDRRLVLVYQPHQHSRTKHLFNDFVKVLKDAADITILSEIYAVKGRMEDRDVSSRDIVEAIKRLSDQATESNNLITQSLNNLVLYGGDLTQTKRVVLEQIKSGDVVIFMGAGDIDNLARELVQE